MTSLRTIDTIVPFVGGGASNNIVDIPEIPILPTIAGTAAFAATLSMATWAQSLLKVSTVTPRPIPSVLGMGAVALASMVCHFVAIESYHSLNNNHGIFDLSFNSVPSLSFVNNAPLRMQSLSSSVYNHHSIPISLPQIDIDFLGEFDVGHAVRVILVGLIAFKGLGGRFWSLSPSSYTHVGSFGRRKYSLVATDAYATKPERALIKMFGRRVGCHTCGDRMIGKPGLKRSGTKFVADHIPPKSVVKQMNKRWYRRIFRIPVRQRFYPQCIDCSIKQSNFLSDASRKIENAKRKGYMLKRIPNLAMSGGGGHAYVHSLRMRKEHIAGGILATATVGNADEVNVLAGNKIRFRNWQLKAEEVLNKSLLHISNKKRELRF